MKNEELGFELFRLRELALSFIPKSFRHLCIRLLLAEKVEVFTEDGELREEVKERIIRAYLKGRLFEDKRVNELWRRIKEIKGKLFQNNEDMIYYFLRRYRIREEDMDNAYSWAVEGLLRAIDTYDYRRASFSTVAYQWVNSYLQRFLSYSRKHMAFSLDSKIQETEEDTFLDLQGTEDESSDMCFFLESLPEHLIEIAFLLSDGAKHKEVKEKLGLTESKYRKLLEELRHYAQEFFMT